MQEVTSYPHGTFSWIDLATSDTNGAKAFYSDLFGWGSDDMPIGEDSFYTMLTLNDKPVAALSQMQPELLEQGVPPFWNSYITVDDADEMVEKAASLGATVIAPTFDVFRAGRMAIIQGPTGAMFSVWEPIDHIGAHYVNHPGTLCWNELATRDPEAAKTFYGELFGWISQDQDMGNDRIYTSFKVGERYNGGMLTMTEEWGEIPPHWMIYIAVEDCDASAVKVAELGGNVLVPPTDIPNTGRFAVVQDPQGGHFTIMALIDPDLTPPEDV